MTLGWIVASGLGMAAIALVGGLTLLLPEATLRRLLLPLVALSAGSMLGGAFFHLLPAAVARMGSTRPFLWAALGFTAFFCLEQFLHWHHCHRTRGEHEAAHVHPFSQLLLVADGVHGFIGGLAVGAAFVVDIRLGISTWLVEAAHEVPQELGDFGALVHGGWSPKKALVYNFLSGLTFLAGALVAWAASRTLDVGVIVPFAAGNFVYVAAVDLVPAINKHERFRQNAVHFACFAGGLGLLWALAQFHSG